MRGMARPGVPLAAARWLALCACLGAAFMGLRGIELDPTSANRLRDDAFYEFSWAANVAAGRGPTVSDGCTTSGVQLLWSLLLVPCAAAFGAASLPLLAPWLGLAVHAATALLWWRSCRRRFVGACVAALWMGHPLLVRECQNGQETALACLLTSLLWLRRRSGEPAWAALSLLAALTRTDLWLVVAGLSVWRAWHQRRGSGLCIPFAVLIGCAGVNRWLGGGFTPDSALPMAWLWHSNQQLVDPSLAAFVAQSWWFARPVLLGGPFVLAGALPLGLACARCVRIWLPPKLRWVPLLLVLLACGLGAADVTTALWAAGFLCLWPRGARAGRVQALPLLAAGLVAIVALHWGVRWYPRDYYLGPLVVLGTAALARCARSHVLLLAAIAQVGGALVLPEPLAGQQELELAGRELATILPVAERVGCFNSGIVTYRADVLAPSGRRRGIVNLDGVVDARTFAALQAATLDAWLDQQGLRFLLDNAVQFGLDPAQPHACGHWFGPAFAPERSLVEYARFDLPGVDNGRPDGDSVRLYWRVGRGALPPRATVTRELGAAADGGRSLLWAARAGQSLWRETADGTRQIVSTTAVDTTVVVHLRAPLQLPLRLFVDADPRPVLVLAPL